MCLIACTTLLPTSDDRIVLKKLAEEVASFKCALSYTTRLEQPVVWLFLVICVDCVTDCDNMKTQLQCFSMICVPPICVS